MTPSSQKTKSISILLIFTSHIIELLSGYSGNIFIIPWDKDQHGHPESAIILYITLLAKSKHVQLQKVSGSDHSFNIKNNFSNRDGWWLR